MLDELQGKGIVRNVSHKAKNGNFSEPQKHKLREAVLINLCYFHLSNRAAHNKPGLQWKGSVICT